VLDHLVSHNFAHRVRHLPVRPHLPPGGVQTEVGLHEPKPTHGAYVHAGDVQIHVHLAIPLIDVLLWIDPVSDPPGDPVHSKCLHHGVQSSLGLHLEVSLHK